MKKLLLLLVLLAACDDKHRALSSAKRDAMSLLAEPVMCEGDDKDGWLCIGTRTGRLVDCPSSPDVECHVSAPGIVAPPAEVP